MTRCFTRSRTPKTPAVHSSAPCTVTHSPLVPNGLSHSTIGPSMRHLKLRVKRWSVLENRYEIIESHCYKDVSPLWAGQSEEFDFQSENPRSFYVSLTVCACGSYAL